MPDFIPPLPPEDRSELIAGYVLGDLTPDEIVLVEEYLAAHPERQAEIASLMLSLDLLPLALPANNPSLSLRQQIMHVAETGSVVAKAPIKQPKITRLWRPAIAGIGLLLLTGLGWNNYRLSQELATVKQNLSTQIAQNKQSQDYRSVVNLLQQPNNRFLTLKSMPGKSMGMGSLIVVPNKSIAVLNLQQLAPILPGQVYRVWAIMGDEEMACADFLPDAEKKVSIQIPLDRWKEVNQVTITIEQKDAKEPEGEIAIEGELGI